MDAANDDVDVLAASAPSSHLRQLLVDVPQILSHVTPGEPREVVQLVAGTVDVTLRLVSAVGVLGLADLFADLLALSFGSRLGGAAGQAYGSCDGDDADDCETEPHAATSAGHRRTANAETISDRRFEIVHDSFATLGQALEARGVARVDGVLLDLGISSPQVDDAARGFIRDMMAALAIRQARDKGLYQG